MIFDGTETIIGRGAQAEVFLYKGFAYKMYKASYPAEWIAFERKQQEQVNKAGLCPVRYYDTGDSHIIKMDFIDGDTLENIIRKYVQEQKPEAMAKIAEGYKLLSHAFQFVHSADMQGLAIPHLRDTAAMGLGDEDSGKILPTIERLSGKMKECICHLDMHFLNIMLLRGKELGIDSDYRIIDWMNARIAPPVFDYARTYVILDEFSKEALELYKQFVMPDLKSSGISDSDFADAVTVCSIIRKHEKGE